jgi:hypothetical protein
MSHNSVVVSRSAFVPRLANSAGSIAEGNDPRVVGAIQGVRLNGKPLPPDTGNIADLPEAQAPEPEPNPAYRGVYANAAEIELIPAPVIDDVADNGETETEWRYTAQANPHYRGVIAAEADAAAIENPAIDDFVDNAETGTEWVYDGVAWADSENPVGATPHDTGAWADSGNPAGTTPHDTGAWADSGNPIGATPHEVMGAGIDGVMTAQGMAELAEQRELLEEERTLARSAEEALDAAIVQEKDDRDTAIADEKAARESAVNAEAQARDTAIAVEATARDAAIARARLATHTWRPATRSKAALPNPAILSPTLNYLYRVIKDDTPANNGVWELIAGATAWTYFSDNADWIDQTELDAAIGTEEVARDTAIGTHNTDGTAHADIRQAVSDEAAARGQAITALYNQIDQIEVETETVYHQAPQAFIQKLLSVGFNTPASENSDMFNSLKPNHIYHYTTGTAKSIPGYPSNIPSVYASIEFRMRENAECLVLLYSFSGSANTQAIYFGGWNQPRANGTMAWANWAKASLTPVA